MPTIFDHGARAAIAARIEAVTATSRPLWGTMNAEEMLTHLVQAMQTADGERATKRRWLPVRYPPLRQLIVYVLPWPKNAPTVPELVPAQPRAVTDGKRELLRLVQDIGARKLQRDWPEHPAFGHVGRRGWGVLVWRHLDHHLRQFGV